MAEIDKGLPNVKQPSEVLNETEANVNIVEETPKGPVEVIEDEEGATIDFDPNAMPLPEEGDHFANLNDLLPEDVTDPLANR